MLYCMICISQLTVWGYLLLQFWQWETQNYTSGSVNSRSCSMEICIQSINVSRKSSVNTVEHTRWHTKILIDQEVTPKKQNHSYCTREQSTIQGEI